MQAFPLGEGAERREAEEVFHAGRFFPEWDHVESKSPLIRPRCAHPPSPQGEGSRSNAKPSPQGREARDSAFLFCHSYQEEF